MGETPKRPKPMNRWSHKKLKAAGYKDRGLVNIYDRTEISAFIAQKISDGGHCVLKREIGGVYRRLYVKEKRDEETGTSRRN